MYEFVTHTWNTVKGECFHDCSYCYMKRWGHLKPVRFDTKELKTDLGEGNFIFVGSSCDMWAKNIPDEWILKTIEKCYEHSSNKYLFQTKNPNRIFDFATDLSGLEFHICTTIESNRHYLEIMKNSPLPNERASAMNEIAHEFNFGFPNKQMYVTIEPIMDFDLKEMVYLIETCLPAQVNIGADTSKSGLPEPPKEKIFELISALEKFTIVHQKSNLKRLLK